MAYQPLDANDPEAGLANQEIRSRAKSRVTSRDPADLLDYGKAKSDIEDIQPITVFDDTDPTGKLEIWNGFTLVDLGNGIPDFVGEDSIDNFKDLSGAFACRQMRSELHFGCGVLVRHLDVPYIEMKGQIAAVLQMLDVSSDLFFIIDLIRLPLYAAVNAWVKIAYYTLFAVSQILWVSMAAFKAHRRWRADIKKIAESGKAQVLGANLTWSLTGKWLLGAFWENLFPSPVTILASRRVVKRTPLGGQAITLAGYASLAGFKFRYNRGAQSLWPTLLLEDLPLLCLQAYILYDVGKAGPVFFINSMLSFVSALHKGSILYEQNKNREIYRKELLQNIEKAAAENIAFWQGVYEDEFGSPAFVASTR